MIEYISPFTRLRLRAAAFVGGVVLSLVVVLVLLAAAVDYVRRLLGFP